MSWHPRFMLAWVVLLSACEAETHAMCPSGTRLYDAYLYSGMEEDTWLFLAGDSSTVYGFDLSVETNKWKEIHEIFDQGRGRAIGIKAKVCGAFGLVDLPSPHTQSLRIRELVEYEPFDMTDMIQSYRVDNDLIPPPLNPLN